MLSIQYYPFGCQNGQQNRQHSSLRIPAEQPEKPASHAVRPCCPFLLSKARSRHRIPQRQDGRGLIRGAGVRGVKPLMRSRGCRGRACDVQQYSLCSCSNLPVEKQRQLRRSVWGVRHKSGALSARFIPPVVLASSPQKIMNLAINRFRGPPNVDV